MSVNGKVISARECDTHIYQYHKNVEPMEPIRASASNKPKLFDEHAPFFRDPEALEGAAAIDEVDGLMYVVTKVNEAVESSTAGAVTAAAAAEEDEPETLSPTAVVDVPFEVPVPVVVCPKVCVALHAMSWSAFIERVIKKVDS